MAAFARGATALAVCLSVGAHWAALQSVAWGRMIVVYSQHDSLAKAVVKTFDGKHPCDLCKHISSAQNSQKKQDTGPVAAKPDLICATHGILLIPPQTDFSFLVTTTRAVSCARPPPTPPPRSELS
jgi:hypothetical protein